MNFKKLLSKNYTRFKISNLKLKKNSIVLVTGAGGSIGSEISKQIFKIKPKKLIILDSNEFSLFQIHNNLEKIKIKKKISTTIIPLLTNLCDYDLLKIQLTELKCNFIFHAAAYKHVNLLQQNPLSGMKNNLIGLHNLLKITSGVANNFIHISTDKAVNPVNVMGLSKKICEAMIIKFSNNSHFTKYKIVRFGNVLNSSGSVIPIFKSQIKNCENVTVTDEKASRYFMTIPEAVSLVINASSLRGNGSIFVLDMGKPFKILDLAKYMIKAAGFNYTYNKPKQNEIKIEFIGIRDGEKIYEDLSNGKLEKTSIKGVLKANEKEKKFINVNKILEILKNKKLIKNGLKKIIDLSHYE